MGIQSALEVAGINALVIALLVIVGDCEAVHRNDTRLQSRSTDAGQTF